jgi:hypothetical protein
MRDMRERMRCGAAALAILALTAGCAKTDETVAPPAASIAVTPAEAAVDAGAPLGFSYRFARVPGATLPTGDLWVFVHLLDDAGTLLWTDDHRPEVPPEKWGAEPVVYNRMMFVPRSATAGRVQVRAGLYSRSDGARVPLSGVDAGGRAYAVATFDVRPASNAAFVSFGDGWHGAERAAEEPMREWRWSSGRARLSFRPPGRDAQLWIELDQPVAEVGTQRVELREGSALLATMPVTPGKRTITLVPLSSGVDAGTPVDLDLTVQPTFAPAAIATLRSRDTRELGVRVFNVYAGAKPAATTR